jgi:probable rRNA maturation factor
MPVRVTVHVGDGLDLRRTAPGLGGRRGVSKVIRAAARATFDDAQVGDASLSIALLSDEAISDLHGRYLRRSTPTDVLSFPLYDEGEAPLGDVYIGLEQVARQAGSLDVELAEELARLAIHGTLHILGHDHPEGAGREKSPMWKLQERILWRLTTNRSSGA